MRISDLWRKSLNDLMIWSRFETPEDGWVCVFHDVPAPAPARLGLVIENGRISSARNLLPSPAFPAPAMLETFEEGRGHILASGREIPVSDALAAFSPLPHWREPWDIAQDSPFSWASRLVWAFRRAAEQEDPSLAGRLPLTDLYREARAHVIRNTGVQALLDMVALDRLEKLADSPLHSDDRPALIWHGVWKKSLAELDPVTRERRLQALEAAPFLAGVIPHFPALRTAVDKGEPLFEAAEKIGLSAKSLSSVAALRLPMAAGKDSRAGAFIDRFQILRELPPDWLKATRLPAERAALARIVDLSISAKSRGLPWDLFLMKSGGKWEEHLIRIAKAGTDRRPPEGMDEAQYRHLRETLPFDEIAAQEPAARQAFARFHVGRLCRQDAQGPSLDDVAAWAARIAAPDTRPMTMHHFLEAMHNMAARFSATVVTPLALHSAGASGRAAIAQMRLFEKISADILFANKSGARASEMTRAFLNNEARILGGTVGHVVSTKSKEVVLDEDDIRRFGLSGADDTQWPMITRPVLAPNGLAVVPLWSKAHLENEGRGWNGGDQNDDGSRGLAICVGSHGYYLAKCLSAKAQILSIRRLGQDGAPVTRLSCVELQVNSATEVKNVQHRGRHNGAPPPEATHALNWWLDRLGDTIAFNPAWQEFVRKGGIESAFGHDHARMLCGYDWRKRQNIEQAWSSWRNVLGKEIPDLNMILARRDVQDIIESISPFAPPLEMPSP